jgi:hypothetical protein
VRERRGRCWDGGWMGRGEVDSKACRGVESDGVKCGLLERFRWGRRAVLEPDCAGCKR